MVVLLETKEYRLTLFKYVSYVAGNAACEMAVFEDMATKFKVSKADLVKKGTILSKTIESDDEFLFASIVLMFYVALVGCRNFCYNISN